jgi:uncharacterized cupin superfamily protein
MPIDKPNLYLLRAADMAARSQTFSHPWNPKSEIAGYQMGKATGLKRIGVNLARLAPGKESFVYHAHWTEEEWIYILEGRGVARIDDATYEVGPGDFMAFPTPENHEHEVADFPDLGKRVFKHKKGADVFDLTNARPFGPLDEGK